jgi:1-acyl-sn-glycerol-3-phosphate acyltransferase
VIGRLAALGLVGFTRMLTGARAVWPAGGPGDAQRVYFGNHSSHGDFMLIWSVLPANLRARTRPVAASDYWLAGPIRRYVAKLINAVLIDRDPGTREQDPIAVMGAAVDAGHSLIVFPEGTRNTTDERLLSFKSGIYWLAAARPALEFVPVWIDNIGRVMPKGEILPLPLLCTARFGEPQKIVEGESKRAFLDRTRASLLALAPPEES